MTPKEIIEYYGGTQLDVQRGTRGRISQSTVSDWVRARRVPLVRQHQLQALTRGALTVDPDAWRAELRERRRRHT